MKSRNYIELRSHDLTAGDHSRKISKGREYTTIGQTLIHATLGAKASDLRLHLDTSPGYHIVAGP